MALLKVMLGSHFYYKNPFSAWQIPGYDIRKNTRSCIIHGLCDVIINVQCASFEAVSAVKLLQYVKTII